MMPSDGEVAARGGIEADVEDEGTPADGLLLLGLRTPVVSPPVPVEDGVGVTGNELLELVVRILAIAIDLHL